MSKFNVNVNEEEKLRILNLHESKRKKQTVIEEQAPPVKLDPLIQQKINYIKSPIYRQRLVAYGVNNPDAVIQDRIKRLMATTFQITQNADAQTRDGGMDKPKIILNPNDSRYVKAHEIGHVTGGDDTSYMVDNPRQAKGNQMSPAEAWYFYNRNKNLGKINKGNYVSSETGKLIQGTGTKTFKQGLYNYETPLSTTKNMHPDPADHLYGGKNILDIVNGKQDPHDIGSSENKADLDSIRQILFDNKITQNYGDNITPEQWKKAMSIPKIANEPHVVRMRKNYEDASITDLNNTIAKNPNINDKSTIA
jgi:hypothetical protein